MSSSPTIITRRKAGEAFTIIRKSIGDDPNLSWQAKGVMLYLLGKPDGWKLRVTDLTRKSSSSNHSVRVTLKELRDKGYAKLERITIAGIIKEWRWTISDEPEFQPDVVIPHLVKPHLSKKESTKNDYYSGAKKRRKNRGNYDHSINPDPTHRDPQLIPYRDKGMEGIER